MSEMKNKKALANDLAEHMNMTKKDALAVVDFLFDDIKETLAAGGKVDVVGFGKFEVKERAPHKGVNPASGEAIEIPAKNVPAFKASKAWKESLS